MEYIDSLLLQARAESITSSEFVATSLSIGFLLGLVFFFSTGALAVSILVIPGGFFLYYWYLLGRRDAAQMEYEKLNIQVAYMLSNGFKQSSSPTEVLERIIANGPVPVKGDWKVVRAAFSGNQPDAGALQRLLTLRNSPGLGRLVDALYRNYAQNAKNLPSIFADIRSGLIREVAIARESAAEMLGTNRQLLYVTLMPVGILMLFTLASPEMRGFYSSPLGQVVIVIVGIINAVVYSVGTRAAANAVRLRPYTPEIRETRTLEGRAARLVVDAPRQTGAGEGEMPVTPLQAHSRPPGPTVQLSPEEIERIKRQVEEDDDAAN
jgi:hypothetical protein